MFPGSSGTDKPNSCRNNAKLSRQFKVGMRRQQVHDCSYLGRGEFCKMALFAVSNSSSRHGLVTILKGRAWMQMFKVDAHWVIAAMQNKYVFREFPICFLIQEATQMIGLCLPVYLARDFGVAVLITVMRGANMASCFGHRVRDSFSTMLRVTSSRAIEFILAWWGRERFLTLFACSFHVPIIHQIPSSNKLHLGSF